MSGLQFRPGYQVCWKRADVTEMLNETCLLTHLCYLPPRYRPDVQSQHPGGGAPQVHVMPTGPGAPAYKWDDILVDKGRICISIRRPYQFTLFGTFAWNEDGGRLGLCLGLLGRAWAKCEFCSEWEAYEHGLGVNSSKYWFLFNKGVLLGQFFHDQLSEWWLTKLLSVTRICFAWIWLYIRPWKRLTSGETQLRSIRLMCEGLWHILHIYSTWLR